MSSFHSPIAPVLSHLHCAASPELPFRTTALTFATRAARGSRGSTIVLHGAVNLPQALLQAYQGRIEAALRLVAVRRRDGAVFQASATGSDQEPLRLAPDAAAMLRDGMQDDPVYRARYVNADLRALLGLPAGADDYDIFPMLDWLLAAPQRIALPPGEEGQEPGATAETECPSAAVFGAAVPAQAQALGPVQLSRDPSGAALLRIGLDPGAPVVLMAQTLLGRAFRYARLPAGPARLRDALHRLDPDAFGLARSTGEVLELTALADGHVTPVLCVPHAP